MSRFVASIEDGGKTASMSGPIRWLSPESLNSQVYNSKTDVYSFGILIWELEMRQLPCKN